MSTRITVRLDATQAEKLQKAARESGKKPSELVREALQAFFQQTEHRPTALEVAESLGLVGCLKDGPEDLSTNKAYMEGFGSS